MLPNETTLLALTGGVTWKLRVQHPKVHQRKDRKGTYWFFRYWHDELLPDGSVKTSRKFHTIGPSKVEGALRKRQAEAERDRFLAELNAAPTRSEAAVLAKEPPEIGAILFGKLAEMWETDFVEREVGGRPLVAASTKQKYRNHLHNHILPRWANTRISEVTGLQIKRVDLEKGCIQIAQRNCPRSTSCNTFNRSRSR